MPLPRLISELHTADSLPEIPWHSATTTLGVAKLPGFSTRFLVRPRPAPWSPTCTSPKLYVTDVLDHVVDDHLIQGACTKRLRGRGLVYKERWRRRDWSILFRLVTVAVTFRKR